MTWSGEAKDDTHWVFKILFHCHHQVAPKILTALLLLAEKLPFWFQNRLYIKKTSWGLWIKCHLTINTGWILGMDGGLWFCVKSTAACSLCCSLFENTSVTLCWLVRLQTGGTSLVENVVPPHRTLKFPTLHVKKCGVYFHIRFTNWVLFRAHCAKLLRWSCLLSLEKKITEKRKKTNKLWCP